VRAPREDIQLAEGQTFRLLRWSRSLDRIEVVQAPGRTKPMHGRGEEWHYHRELELTLIQRGAGTRFVADHIELFEPGDLVLLGANVPHCWHPRGASAGVSLQWDLPLDHGLWNIGETAGPLRKLNERAQRGLHLRGEAARQAREQIQQFAELGGLEQFAAFIRLLGTLSDAPERELHPLSERAFALAGTVEHQDAIRRAVSYILAHYRDAVRLEDLHALTGMSRATFARQFQRHAGKPFSTFLNQVRLQAVCRALRDTMEPISAIALGNGFNQLSFFNRLFRREFRIHPGGYRENSQRAIMAASRRKSSGSRLR
jgi:AraC-like DNA-binding protein